MLMVLLREVVLRILERSNFHRWRRTCSAHYSSSNWIFEEMGLQSLRMLEMTQENRNGKREKNRLTTWSPCQPYPLAASTRTSGWPRVPMWNCLIEDVLSGFTRRYTSNHPGIMDWPCGIHSELARHLRYRFVRGVGNNIFLEWGGWRSLRCIRPLSSIL